MFNALSPTYKGILLALTGYSAFAIADVCAKYLTQSYSVYQLVTVDSFMSCLLLLAVSPWIGGFKNLWNRKNLKVHAARGILNFLISLLIVYSFARLPLANVYTLIFTVPFISALLSIPLFGEKVTGTRWIAIAVGFIGVAVAIKPGGAIDPLLVLVMLCAILIAVMFMLGRYLDKPSIFSLGFFPVAGTLFLTLPLALPGFKMIALHDLPLFMLQGGGVVIGMIFVSVAFRIAPAAAVAPFMYVEMIWAVIFGLLIFGDVPDFVVMIGAVIIIASGLYLIETERRASKPSQF